MPGGNFDDTLKVKNNGAGAVIAMGPLAASVNRVEVMCAWVVQRNGAEDAIANEMGPVGDGLTLTLDPVTGAPARWAFPLTDRLGTVDFTPGWGTAMAIGVFEDVEGNRRAFYWAETVALELVAGGTAEKQAKPMAMGSKKR
jgi:hypothetical protein